VITTNYDDLYYQARRTRVREEGGDEDNLVILGRSPRDCKLVISSLTGPLDCRLIWHVQGLLGGFGEKMPTGLESLRDQLVIGHAEYRAVTNRSPDFRRCFGEVFNSRSLLFLGSSLNEDYFLNLFGEILDLCGPSSVPHFALTRKCEVSAKFLADQMNITVCEFDDWRDLPVRLDRLASAITQPAIKTVRHTYSVHADACTTIDIVDSRNPPVEPQGHEAVFFVARRKDLKRLARRRLTISTSPPGQSISKSFALVIRRYSLSRRDAGTMTTTTRRIRRFWQYLPSSRTCPASQPCICICLSKEEASRRCSVLSRRFGHLASGRGQPASPGLCT
jgi:hypothetical protein